MKKVLLAFCILAATRSGAQIVNYSFENWALDTFYLASGVISNLPADTITYLDPVGWTSSNTFTDLDSLGNKILVTPDDTSAEDGALSIRMYTAPMSIPVTGIGHLNLVIPGFALNGRFNINPQSLLLGGSSQISPGSVAGAGQPCSQRLADFTGYYNYTPVVNPHYHGNDSCLIWATLRKGSLVVANAIFKSDQNTYGFSQFTVPFKYLNCEVPDTLVILLSSSLTTVAAILDTTTGLVPGSVLLVDNISYDTLVGAEVVPPTAEKDIDTVHENRVDSLNVLRNDSNCSDAVLTVSIVSGPFNGAASPYDSVIVYAPNLGFGGWDSIYYKDTDPNGDSSRAWLKIFVRSDAGISETNEISMQVFPVPASNELNIRFNNPGRTNAGIYDMLGNLVMTANLTADNNTISVAELASGLYCLQLVNEKNIVISRAKFTVTK